MSVNFLLTRPASTNTSSNAKRRSGHLASRTRATRPESTSATSKFTAECLFTQCKFVKGIPYQETHRRQMRRRYESRIWVDWLPRKKCAHCRASNRVGFHSRNQACGKFKHLPHRQTHRAHRSRTRRRRVRIINPSRQQSSFSICAQTRRILWPLRRMLRQMLHVHMSELQSGNASQVRRIHTHTQNIDTKIK